MRVVAVSVPLNTGAGPPSAIYAALGNMPDARGRVIDPNPVKSTSTPKAKSWAARLNASGFIATVEKGESAIGGGSLPGETLPTWLVTIRVEQAGGAGGEQSAGHVAEQLRYEDPPIITRVERGALLIDPRTVQEDEEEILLSHLGRILANLES